MSLPRFSVRRPIFTTMLVLAIVVLGLVSLDRLRIDLLPDIELPTVSISTDLEGASPEVVERLVTQIIEEVVATVPGAEEITSTSSEGSSRVRVRFAWGTNLDAASIELQARLETELEELPDDVERPRVRKFDIQSFPVVILGVSSRLDPVELTEIVEDQVRYRFARLDGVAQVDVWGGYPREVRVEIDPYRLQALGIPLDQVLAALRDANLDRPSGKLEDGRYEITLRAPGEFRNLDEIRDTVVYKGEGDGGEVLLRQIAKVEDTYEKLTRLVRVDGEQGMRVAIRKQADANTVEVSRRILEQIEEVNRAYPQLRVVAVSNQGNFIERSIANVAQSVLYGGALAILVLLFFLRNLRSTLVISLAIPISVIGTFALIYFGGLTLNLMTLGGLALGVGMMVDNSVVVLENIYRRRNELGESAADASVEGAGEVAAAIVASTVTTLVIFLPLAFVRGVSGFLFKELAYVVVFALSCSLLVALSLVPMLSSRMLARAAEPATTGILGALGRGLDALDSGYRSMLDAVLARPWTTVLSAALLVALSMLLLPRIGSEFLPPSDEGQVRITGEMEIGTRLELVDRQTRSLEELVLPAVPEIESSIVTVGASFRDASAASRGEISLNLVPAAERGRDNLTIATALRERLEGKIPGMEIRTRAPQGQFLLQRVLGSEEGLEVEVRGYDLDTLDELAGRAAAVLQGTAGVTDVEISRKSGVPQREIEIDRRKIADLGLSVRDVTEALQTAFAGSRAGSYRASGNSYRILVQLEDAEHLSIDEVLDLTLSTPSGAVVALRNFVSTESSLAPLVIERRNQQRLVKVSAGTDGRDLGSIARDVQAGLDRIPRPSGHELLVAGSIEEQAESFRELLISFILAIVLVYMVLACQYESLRDPIVVMFSVPVAAVGVLLTLFLTRTTLNVQTYIGCIMLGGIVVNNAILLVDQASRLVREGTPLHEAVAESGRRRLRPILMTTLTTVLALLPLALGIGEGADAQAPLARAVVGGLTGSTLITLLLIPAVYVLAYAGRREHC
ncbi:MAG: efflux RND transporter permease subunit [Planctomycetes bacterium]|nr:efflux RND transporter permease subunit [Planctomycetota bacterium]MCB9917083.1 efflux RND transporter permease subunit [Planctomycetota bacterium]